MIVSYNEIYLGEKEEKMERWIDTKTNLVWELKNPKNADEEYSIKEALSYCEKLNATNAGGYSDWRLPTLEELISVGVVEFFRYEGNHKEWKQWYEAHADGLIDGYFIIPELSKNIGVQGWYWSGSKKDEKEYYLINYKDGNTNSHEPNQQFYVRCVRG